MARNEPCTWTETEDGPWETSCGNIFEFTDGTLVDNRFNYCPYCGADVAEECYSHDLEDEEEP